MNTPHAHGEFYPNSQQQRLVLTRLHRNCGGQVLRAFPWSWKTQFAPKQDGTLCCCLCNQQPVTENETYEDYC